jgi:aryl-alcohol dehydrogenase-like predicted oxidoreductase
VGGRPLPDFAREIGATSWAQLCLKYILANPAVTVVIPGTDDPEHMVDNMGAGRGELPDADLRRRIEQIFD